VRGNWQDLGIVLVGGLLSSAVVVLAINSDHANDSVNRLTRQNHDLTSQVTVLRADVGLLKGKSSGAAADLITCQDLQNLGLQILYSVSLNNDGTTISATPSQTPVTLPQHCINR